ncbi:AraC family transcriptional regulator (plasmid) [Fulvitalea axinellae]|uniref:AraC family transcriptional regulator n=2 Tax=Fulvitalea axinellae TaxID=1182444 RepID=A0AAU9CKJ7_9BACT|nr:AraC family transcriptional regulator [Fulvitalea axinellae]
MHEQGNFPPPENPLFSILHEKVEDGQTASCEKDFESVSLTNNFYTISLKNIISGEILYGRTKYDCSTGTMIFTAPNQTMVINQIVFSSELYYISFHKEYLIGHPLFDKIKKYNFFNYNVNEALHLSPKEEELIKSIFRNIQTEYHNNQDEFSKNLILSHLDALLHYADRFYKRQFLNRKEINQALFTRFKHILDMYFEANQLEEKGIPTVEWLANQLGVSHRYMSDTIKAETGKTAVDQINLYLVEEAKNLLLKPNASISETAYKLGFEYPQYFSRLFKKKVGMSPKQYVESSMMN